MEEKQILQHFQTEAMNFRVEVTLPFNLTDYWLSEIQKHLENLFESTPATAELKMKKHGFTCSSRNTHLFTKEQTEKLEVSLNEIFTLAEYYHTELTLEEIRGKSDFKANPASIQTVFTNRDVSIT